MRAVRLPLAGIAIFGLLGSLSLVVVAQDEADPMAPAYFTFSEPAWEPSTDEEDEYSDKVTPEVRGYLEVGHLGASDSRASGRLTSVTNMNMLEVEGGGVATGASSMRLVNDGGAWSGTSQGLLMFAEGGGATSMAVLAGEGGYEGLTLILVQYADDDTVTNRGVIVPSDQMPPLPEPAE